MSAESPRPDLHRPSTMRHVPKRTFPSTPPDPTFFTAGSSNALRPSPIPTWPAPNITEGLDFEIDRTGSRIPHGEHSNARCTSGEYLRFRPLKSFTSAIVDMLILAAYRIHFSRLDSNYDGRSLVKQASLQRFSMDCINFAARKRGRPPVLSSPYSPPLHPSSDTLKQNFRPCP